MFESPTINAVVGGIQTSFREPYDITSFKTTCSDCFEWAIPVQQSISLLDHKIKSLIDTQAGDRRENIPLPTTYLIHDQQSLYEQSDMHGYRDRCVVAWDPLSNEAR
jgi:hypothetical protein